MTNEMKQRVTDEMVEAGITAYNKATGYAFPQPTAREQEAGMRAALEAARSVSSGEAIGAIDPFHQQFASAETHDVAMLVGKRWTPVYTHPSPSSVQTGARRSGTSKLVYDKERRTIINSATGEPALSASVQTGVAVKARKAITYLRMAGDSFKVHAKITDGHPEEIAAYEGSAQMMHEAAAELEAALTNPSPDNAGLAGARRAAAENVSSVNSVQIASASPDPAVAEMRAALEPFAKEADARAKLALGEDIDHWPIGGSSLTLGDLRRAKIAFDRNSSGEAK